MKTEKVDRRVRATKRALRQALTQLLQEKPMRALTVKELCLVAKINRATFYAHYSDINDLMQQIEDEMYAAMWNLLKPQQMFDEIDEDKPIPAFLHAFQFLTDNSDMCSVMLGPNGNRDFMRKMMEACREHFVRVWSERFHTDDVDRLNYVYSFVASGCIGIFNWWLNEGMKESPEVLALRAQRLILYGMDNWK